MSQYFPSTIIIPESVRAIMARLNQLAAVRVVGGAVRDQLLQELGLLPEAKNGDDDACYDLAIKTTPAALKKHAEQFADWRLVLDGFSHGIIRIISNGMMVEVACLRRDIATDGRHATVAFDGDWADDAARRDFTLNALYAEADGTVIDPLGILQDFSPPRLRFIGNADKRIQEDYLRILRYYRFLATLPLGEDDAGGKIETRKIIVAHKIGLQKIASERVGMELLKILSSPKATSIIVMMAEDSIWQEFAMTPAIGLIKKILPTMKKTIHSWPSHRAVAFYYLLLADSLNDDLKDNLGDDLKDNLGDNLGDDLPDDLKANATHFAWPRIINNLLSAYRVADKTADHFAFHYRHGDDIYHLLLMKQWLGGDITAQQHDELSAASQPIFPLAKTGDELLARGFTARDFATILPRLEKKWLASRGILSKAELLSDIGDD